APLDQQEVTEAAALPDSKSELFEVSLDRTNEVTAPDDLAHLRPFSNDIICQGHPEDVGEAGRAIGNGALISHHFRSSCPYLPSAASCHLFLLETSRMPLPASARAP